VTVVQFKPENGQKLENIPHMLRYWADAMEAVTEALPKTALLVLHDDAEQVPDFCIFGADVSRTELIGMFAALAQRVGVTMERP
jgi:hypothetical protein